MFLVSRHVELQLFKSFNHLLLVLGFGRLLTAARRTGKKMSLGYDAKGDKSSPENMLAAEQRGFGSCIVGMVLVMVRALTCSRWSTGCPVLSSADCRRSSCSVETDCGSSNCAGENKRMNERLQG